MSTISVIIPTLNEEQNIGRLLDQLCLIKSKDLEIIVVDGGSQDSTLNIIKQYNSVKLIDYVKGRAIQMNAGAKSAQGEQLLFLHADSKLSTEMLNNLTSIKSDAGSFRMKFKANGFLFLFYSMFTKINWTIFTYGDQGLWIKKSLFQKIGGFKEIPLLEDIDIVSRIKRVSKFEKIPFFISTSARRFKKNGVLKQQLINVILVTAYYIGFSPQFLSRFYRY